MSDSPVTFRNWLSSVSFRTKFLLFGLLLAGPLAVATGFALATYGQQVEVAQKRVDALHHGKLVRALLLTVARHRGLSTTLQSGAEDQSSALVATQALLERDLRAFLAAFGTLPWAAVAPPDPRWLADELHALMKLPETRSEQSNFQRHTRVTEELLSTSRRIGGMFGVEAGDAAVYALAYVELTAQEAAEFSRLCKRRLVLTVYAVCCATLAQLSCRPHSSSVGMRNAASTGLASGRVSSAFCWRAKRSAVLRSNMVRMALIRGASFKRSGCTMPLTHSCPMARTPCWRATFSSAMRPAFSVSPAAPGWRCK